MLIIYCSYLWVIAVSIVMYSGSAVWTIVMCFWYTRCWLNIAFIATTALWVCVMPLIARKTQVIYVPQMRMYICMYYLDKIKC